MIIESTYISKNKETGIYYIIVNTQDKWINYYINQIIDLGKISISVYHTYSQEYMPGQWEDIDEEETEYIDIEENFNSFDYLITSMQKKDQITLICIPKKLITTREFFKELKYVRCNN